MYMCMQTNIPKCARCESGRVFVFKDMSLVCRRGGFDSRKEGDIPLSTTLRIEIVTKEPIQYCRLLGHYIFLNLITGEEVFTNGYSRPIPSEQRWEKLETAREQAIDYALNIIFMVSPPNRKKCKSEWILKEIFCEQWSKYDKS